MHRELLWERFKEGDSNAFEAIYNEYVDNLLSYGFRFTKDISLIEDSIHNLFVRLYERRHSIAEPKSIKAYLYTSLRREILSKGQPKEQPQPTEQELRFSLDINIEQVLIKGEIDRELLHKLEQTLSKLSARQREVIYLSFYNNLSNDEIAEVLQISNQSVRNLLSQGLKRMRAEANLPLGVVVALLHQLLS
jgi:RNA polymerase sigma factor, sigma-70 family